MAKPDATTKKATTPASTKKTPRVSSPNKSPSSPQKSSPKKSSPKKTKAPAQQHKLSNSLEVFLPSSLGNATGDCTVLVQIDPEDSATLDFEGSTGAVGRFSVDNCGIVLDLKGSQYQGAILPGPTAMVAAVHYDEHHQQQLRIEAITDEFCPLVQTQDLMATLEGRVEGTLDDSYRVQEEDVNIVARREEQKLEQAKKKQAKAKGTSNSSTTPKSGGPKRKASTGGSSAKSKSKAGSSNKKVKVSMGRKKS